MSIDDFAKLDLIKTVVKKNGKYSVNNAPYQSVESLIVFLFKQRSITVDAQELKGYLDELAQKEKISEKDIQIKVQKMFGGKREVHTPVGYIDLVTDDMICEVKLAKDFKHSVGQIMAYSKFFSTHQKAIYLFGNCPANIYECYQLCKENNIKLYAEFW